MRNLNDEVVNGLSPEASPVRILASPVRARDSGEGGQVFGLSTGELLGTYNPDTQSLRTLERSLFEDLTPFLVRLPRSGTMRNGRIYEQKTWVLRTGEKESGSLHTPTSKANQNAPSMRSRDKGSWFPTPHGLSANQGQGDGEFGKAIRQSTEATGQLNPTWVDWLMGYPAGWTDCEGSEIQLSLK